LIVNTFFKILAQLNWLFNSVEQILNFKFRYTLNKCIRCNDIIFLLAQRDNVLKDFGYRMF